MSLEKKLNQGKLGFFGKLKRTLAYGLVIALGYSGIIFGSGKSSSPDPLYKITFQSNRDGNMRDYIMNSDGSNLQRVMINSNDDLYFDGKKTVFVSNKDGNDEIYLRSVSNVKRLTKNTAKDWLPILSLDETMIVFVSNRSGYYAIYTMDTCGNNVRQLTRNLTNDFTAKDWLPALSPDGTKIAYCSKRLGNYEISVMDAITGSLVGSGLGNLTKNLAGDYRPVWNPDGSKIAFESYRDENYEIYVMDAITGSLVGPGLGNLTDNPSCDIHPVWLSNKQ